MEQTEERKLKTDWFGRADRFSAEEEPPMYRRQDELKRRQAWITTVYSRRNSARLELIFKLKKNRTSSGPWRVVPGLFFTTFGRDPDVAPRGTLRLPGYFWPVGAREEFNSELNSTRAPLTKRRRDLIVRTPRGTPPVAGIPPGHISYVTDQMNRIKPMPARLLNPAGASRGYIPDGHRHGLGGVDASDVSAVMSYSQWLPPCVNRRGWVIRSDTVVRGLPFREQRSHKHSAREYMLLVILPQLHARLFGVYMYVQIRTGDDLGHTRSHV
ncbi:hypothetical protein Bbelb_046060 [Branchiostoma belcheri]|nr:hypothetical protein Bbelb_046060 [Branchiostoma belcheri]